MEEKTTYDEAYVQGHKAGYEGAEIIENPYKTDPLYRAWYRGWKRAKYIRYINGDEKLQHLTSYKYYYPHCR